MNEKIRVTADDIRMKFTGQQARELYAEIYRLNTALRDAYDYSSTSHAIRPDTPMLDAVQAALADLGFDQ